MMVLSTVVLLTFLNFYFLYIYAPLAHFSKLKKESELAVFDLFFLPGLFYAGVSLLVSLLVFSHSFL